MAGSGDAGTSGAGAVPVRSGQMMGQWDSSACEVGTDDGPVG